MIRFWTLAGTLAVFLAELALAAEQPDLRPIQHRFVEIAISAERLHIQDTDAWRHFWHRFAESDPPQINLDQNDIIVIFMGTQSSGGFFVRVEDIEATSEGTRIRVLLCRPSRNTMHIAEVTSPYTVRLTPNLVKPIEWMTVTGRTGEKPC